MTNTKSFFMTAVLLAMTITATSVSIMTASTDVPFAFAESESRLVTITDNATNLECEEQDICLTESGIIIGKGQTVTWQNNDYVTHSIKSGSHQNGSDRFFSSPRIMSGDSFSQIFSHESLYNYYCPSHLWINGAILVQ
ncbi:MAG: cupredoxin domain-containing protein [Nitrosopumilus sp.]